MSEQSPVTVEQDGHVLLIGLNRPEKMNAVNLEVIKLMSDAYERLGTDPELRVGLVFAHGDNFSAGLDLAEVGPAVAEAGPAAIGGEATYDPYGVWGDPVPKPIVMAMQGRAYTLSIELALASDIVVAAEDTRYRQLEVARGIMPFGGATFRAPQSLGWGNAMRFLLTGEEFSAQTAKEIGLVQEVVPVGEQLAKAKEIAHLIAAQAPLAVQATLANARVGRSSGPEAARADLSKALPKVLRSRDALEGVQSFIERRDAKFTGA